MELGNKKNRERERETQKPITSYHLLLVSAPQPPIEARTQAFRHFILTFQEIVAAYRPLHVAGEHKF